MKHIASVKISDEMSWKKLPVNGNGKLILLLCSVYFEEREAGCQVLIHEEFAKT